MEEKWFCSDGEEELKCRRRVIVVEEMRNCSGGDEEFKWRGG